MPIPDKNNKLHADAGNSNGGQFIKKDGSGSSGNKSEDRVKSDGNNLSDGATPAEEKRLKELGYGSERKEKSNKKMTAEESRLKELGVEERTPIRGALNRIKNFSAESDGTFDFETGESVSFNNGYQVSFQQSTINYTDEEYDNLTNEIAERTKSNAYIGYFGESEISFHCQDLETAVEIMKKYNQHSIYDWKTGKIIENKINYDKEKNPIKR